MLCLLLPMNINAVGRLSCLVSLIKDAYCLQKASKHNCYNGKNLKSNRNLLEPLTHYSTFLTGQSINLYVKKLQTLYKKQALLFF